MFIEFNTAEEAERAKSVMDRHPFDSKHRFQVNLLTELEAITEMDESFTEPEPEVFKTKVFWANCQPHIYLTSAIGTSTNLVG
jgi:hypothetical protein